MLDKLIGLVVLFLGTVMISSTACFAAIPTESQIRGELSKSNYLPASTRITVATDAKQSDAMTIAMFAQQDANEKDCKIDALLIGKTVMELSGGDVTKVTVYFYSLTMSTYKAVSVRNLDVRAFAAGGVNKDELLKSLDLTLGKVGDNPQQVERFLQEKRFASGNISAAITADELQINSSSINTSTDTNAKIDALQLALTVLPVVRAGIHKITVNFADSQSQRKSITFTVDDLKSMSTQVQTVLAPMVVTTSDVEENKHSEKK